MMAKSPWNAMKELVIKVKVPKRMNCKHCQFLRRDYYSLYHPYKCYLFNTLIGEKAFPGLECKRVRGKAG